MTEQTSTADLQIPRLRGGPRAGGRAGAPAGILHRPWPQQGDRVAGAETARRR